MDDELDLKIDFDLDLGLFDDEEKIDEPQISARAYRRAEKTRLQRLDRHENLGAVMAGGLPHEGETIHIISAGRFDFWSFIPWLVNEYGIADEFYGSTWTMNYGNVQEMFALYDAGLVKTMAILGGDYFKNRETAVFATLVEGMRSRKLRVVCFKNHTKVALVKLRSGEHITIEGSANFTANYRIEQFCISRDEGLYQFHRQWMEEALSTKGKNKMSQI